MKFEATFIIITFLISNIDCQNKKINARKHSKTIDSFNNPYEKTSSSFYQEVSLTMPKSNPEDTCQLNIQCTGSASSQLKLPIYGPKGDQGPPGMVGAKGEKGEPGIAGIPAREPPPPNFSAFFATLKNNTGPHEQDTNLVFSNVITNYGNNYDPQTGMYTAPYNGVYQFFVTVSATGRQKAGVNVMKNQHSVLTVWSESHPWSTTTQTIILKLQIFDRVYLRLLARASHLHGYHYSNFAGSLMYEEVNQI